MAVVADTTTHAFNICAVLSGRFDWSSNNHTVHCELALLILLHQRGMLVCGHHHDHDTTTTFLLPLLLFGCGLVHDAPPATPADSFSPPHLMLTKNPTPPPPPGSPPTASSYDLSLHYSWSYERNGNLLWKVSDDTDIFHVAFATMTAFDIAERRKFWSGCYLLHHR